MCYQEVTVGRGEVLSGGCHLCSDLTTFTVVSLHTCPRPLLLLNLYEFVNYFRQTTVCIGGTCVWGTVCILDCLHTIYI